MKIPSKPFVTPYQVLVIYHLLMIISGHCFSQTKYLVEDYWVENYNKNDGLPENAVREITQDKKGYLWLTTQTKLVRFDGYEFLVFDPEKQFPDLKIHFSYGLTVDADGIIWASTVFTGLLSFDTRTGKFTHYSDRSKNYSFVEHRIRAILEDRKLNLWIGAGNGLTQVQKLGDSVHFKLHANFYSQNLLSGLDSVVSQKQPLMDLSKVGDSEFRQGTIELKETTKILVACMGEYNQGSLDHGWIENETGVKIWALNDQKFSRAGGAGKNKLQVDMITLERGRYNVFYRSDDTHSWNKWNDVAPDRPNLWGITLYKADESMVHLESAINEGLKSG